MRLILGVCVLIALVAPQPASSQHGLEHGKLIVRLPLKALRSVILPNAENTLVVMVNRVRRTHGLSPLIVDASLRAFAREHSQDMVLRGYVGHGSFGGRTLRDRLARFVRPGARISENVAMVQTIEQGHVAFVASPAHFHNMLDPTFHRVGIGVATAGDLGIVITEDFT
jgi:uncharacterized protein YkwD